MAYDSMSGWVAGYLTAYNQFTPDTYNILGNSDLIGVLLWIKNYCEKNPLDSAAAALKNLTPELYPRRTVKAP